MHYFASLSRKYGCTNILEIDDVTYEENVSTGYEYENEFCIRIDSYRDDLIYQKKYVNGEWVPGKPTDFEVNTDKLLAHMPDDMWLNEAIGDLSKLHTNAATGKTSLVDAINHCFVRLIDIERALATSGIQVEQQGDLA